MTKIEELTSLAETINEQSNKINRTIDTVNQKLAKLNLGIEVIADRCLSEGDWGLDYETQSRQVRTVAYLGFGSLKDKWQLLVKQVDEVRDPDLADTEDDNVREENAHWIPLLQASRELRVAALEEIPSIVYKLKYAGERLVSTIQAAEKFAESL